VITGYNTDVKHRDRVFHIQTEDRGELHPYIESFVYVGGEILGGKRTPYEDSLRNGGDDRVLRELMEQQHRNLIAAIRSGSFDAADGSVQIPADMALSAARPAASTPRADRPDVFSYPGIRGGEAHRSPPPGRARELAAPRGGRVRADPCALGGEAGSGLPGTDWTRRRLCGGVPHAPDPGRRRGGRGASYLSRRLDRDPVPDPENGVSPAATEVRIRVNGDVRAFPTGTSVRDLLAILEVSTPRVAVERNREILPKASYDSTSLEEGDELEVVEFVGGG
jgi:thiamine biosynthesis protein ThiS